MVIDVLHNRLVLARLPSLGHPCLGERRSDTMRLQERRVGVPLASRSVEQLVIRPPRWIRTLYGVMATLWCAVVLGFVVSLASGGGPAGLVLGAC
jgi:hypothetical protein